MRPHFTIRSAWRVAVLAVAGLGALASAAPARPKPTPVERRLIFGGIPWYTPADSAGQSLAAKGYRIVPGTREAVVAEGRTFDHVSVVRGMLDDSAHVVRWEVQLIPRAGGDLPPPAVAPWATPTLFPEMKRVYDQIVKECEGRYGRAADAVEHYDFPYERGDGRSAEALHDHQATIRTVWRNTARDRLVIEMDPDVNVVLTYSCPGWDAFQDRVRHGKGRDL